MDERRKVVIIGSGPAGLLLGHLLKAANVDCVVLERRSRAYVEGRIRAGVLERVTTDLLHRLGIDQGLNANGLLEEGFNLAYGEELIRIEITRLTGQHVTVYGQTEVTRDLIDAAGERGLEVVFEAEGVALHDLTGSPSVTFTDNGEQRRIAADFIVGCDGFRGVSRASIPLEHLREVSREYPFGWLGILADVPPCHPELIYANGERGFALASMRSPMRSRYYLQVPLTERLEEWSEDRLWDELAARFDALSQRGVVRGPALEMSIAPLRSYVCETMRYGRLFLAGDAAHIVPPTGAKGLNLAASDVSYLADALIAHFAGGEDAPLEQYQQRALARIWNAERFSLYLTKLMHHFPEEGPFGRSVQQAEFRYLARSEAMQKAVAENYVGMPL